jgi:hypothetical protein
MIAGSSMVAGSSQIAGSSMIAGTWMIAGSSLFGARNPLPCRGGDFNADCLQLGF